MRRSFQFCLSVVAFQAFACGPVAAAVATATFNVKIVIASECKIQSTATLNFGSDGVLDANVDAATTLGVQCTKNTAYTVGLSAGAGSGATVAARKMTGGGTDTVTYALYRDAGRTLVWGTTTGTDTVAGTGNGAAQNLTVYGRVPVQTTPAPDTYTDTITVTVTY